MSKDEATMKELLHAADVTINWLLASPFWQGVAGSYIGNVLFSIPIGGIMIWLVSVLARQMWTWRRGLFLWFASSALVFLTLLAFRFNTATIINARFMPRHLTGDQKDCIARGLSKHGGSLQLTWAAANAEAYGYASDLGEAINKGKWTITTQANSFLPVNGVLLLFPPPSNVSNKTPEDLAVLITTLIQCGVQIQPSLNPNETGYTLYIGNKPSGSP